MPRHGRCARRYRYHDIVLVVVYQSAFTGWLEVHDRLRKAYRPLFRQVVFTGETLQLGDRKAQGQWCCREAPSPVGSRPGQPGALYNVLLEPSGCIYAAQSVLRGLVMGAAGVPKRGHMDILPGGPQGRISVCLFWQCRAGLNLAMAPWHMEIRPLGSVGMHCKPCKFLRDRL